MFKQFSALKWLALLGVIVLIALGVAIYFRAPAGPTTVRVTADEFNLKPNVNSVSAGKVTFQVVNQGKLEHEMVILKTDLAVASLKPRAADPDKVDEEALAKNIGEIEDIGVGETKSDTFDLTPGRYVLICNVAGHYKAGMSTAFEVK
ncbi:MAG: copper-binding protein [Chloroflexi bacterium]|nr:copper-binding protein [Chloroflexota bacterium]